VARAHGFDPALIVGLVRVESSFDRRAKSRVGAQGLMQVMPSTARGMRCGDLLDPEENLECGVRILRHFVDRYQGDLVYGLSGYNAGYRMPDRARAAGEKPGNHGFVDKVLTARNLYGRHGCRGR
jgi:soluble lytic murein transglycosylase-like protein